MSDILISVLMPVYNSVAYLAEAIDSILNQTHKNFELIIIDDGSTDDSLEVLKTYEKNDERIRLVSRENKGISVTRNELISLARGEYVVWMDSDDRSHKLRLAKQVEYLNSNPGVVAVGCLVEFIDNEGLSICEWKAPLANDEIDAWHIAGKGAALIFPSSMMAKGVVESVGKFDENLTGAEDLCLFLKLSEKGRVENLNELLFTYRLHISSISHSQQVKIRLDTQKVVNEARERRGLSKYTLIFNDSKVSIAGTYMKWGWWALKDKNILTARKYAIKSIYSDMFKLQAWKLLACSIRGY